MKENLQVEEFSLKRIVENLDKIPRNGRFGDEVKKLTSEEKKKLQDMVANFNEYGKVLRCETALQETTKTLNEIAKMAETYAMTESSDFFQAEVVKRDFKSLKQVNKEFGKLANECHGRLMQLNALYEDYGNLMERYFDVKSLDEMASMFEDKPEDSDIAPRTDDPDNLRSRAVDANIGKMQSNPSYRPSPFDK